MTTWGPTSIAADADDGFVDNTTWYADRNPDNVGFQYGDSTTHCGFRWINVTVPPGATISSAILSLHAQANKTGASNVPIRVSADDVDDAAAWSESSHPASGYTATTAYHDFSVAAWVSGTQYDYEIKDAIQEVISRAGWHSGHALRVAFKGNSVPDGNVLHILDFNTSESDCAFLTITYTEGSIGGALNVHVRKAL